MIVPLSFVVQMLPVSVNGFGVREATFSLYFTRLGLPIESAVLMSLVAAAVIMVFSLTGAAVYVARGTPLIPVRSRRKSDDFVQARRLVLIERPQVPRELVQPREDVAAILVVVAVHVKDGVSDAARLEHFERVAAWKRRERHHVIVESRAGCSRCIR